MEATAPAVEQPLRSGKRPTVRPAREYKAVDVPLRDVLDADGNLQLNPDVEAKGYFTVQLTKGKVRLQARGFVGLIPLNDRVIIDVKPRVPVRNFPRLLRISGYVPPYLGAERPYATDPNWNESFIDLLAGWLLSRLDAVASAGLYQGYERREDAFSFPKGRVLSDATLTRLWPRGIRHQAMSTWFERTADNPPNRCLKYAIWFVAGRLVILGSRTGPRRRLLQRLSALYELYASVPLDHSLSFLDDPLVKGARSMPALRHYYRPALDLAAMIIRRHSVDVEVERRKLSLPSMVLDMDTIFESYLRNVLVRQTQQSHSTLKILDGNGSGKKLLFDQPPSEKATPDIVLRDAEGDTRLVIEVKNIPTKANSSRDAIEQAVTYAASFRCNRVVLAHPRARHEQPPGLRLQGKIGDLAVYQYVFDLGAQDLAADEQEFTEAMVRLCENRAV